MDALDAFEGSYMKQMSNKALEKRVPLGGTFELLPYCNMDCNMCYIVHKENEVKNQLKSVEFWKCTIDQAIENGMLYILLTGGEPLLYPQFKELDEYIAKKPVYLTLNTNATLINREMAEWMSKMSFSRINISLYGASNETYARLCHNPKGFTQVTQAFELLNEYKIPFRVHTTLTPDNYEDFEKMKDVCDKYRAPLLMVSYVFPPYRKDKGVITNNARFSPQKAAEVTLRVAKNQLAWNPERWYESVEMHCAAFENPQIYGAYGERKVLCRGGLASFWVDWRGNVSGCGINTLESIDLEKESFTNAWKKVVDSTEKIQLSAKCQYCKYRCICPVCAAAAFCETGDISGTSEYLCQYSEEYAKLLLEERERLRKIDNGNLL